MRYTFAVCTHCGVQSPPLILRDGEPASIIKGLEQMDWKFDRLRFNIMATCPACKNAQEDHAKTA